MHGARGKNPQVKLNSVPNMTSSRVNESDISTVVLETQFCFQPFRKLLAVNFVLVWLKVIQAILKGLYGHSKKDSMKSRKTTCDS